MSNAVFFSLISLIVLVLVLIESPLKVGRIRVEVRRNR